MIGLIGTLILLPSAVEGQVQVLYDSQGFEALSTGPLPGRDGWQDTTTSPFNPPDLISDPTGQGKGVVLRLDPPGQGNPGGQTGVFRPVTPSPHSLLVIEWDQYRGDLVTGQPPEGDNFWTTDDPLYGNWWALQWDQYLQIPPLEFPPPGVALKPQDWQHVTYLFNFQEGKVHVELDDARNTRILPGASVTSPEGIAFEVEPTPSGLSDDGPILVDNVKIRTTALMAARNEISVSTGGAVKFYLDAGPAHGGRPYMMLAGASGTTPGIPLPGGQVVLPINWDPLTRLMLPYLNSALFYNFAGVLGSAGRAVTQFQMAPFPAGAGLELNFAYGLLAPWDFVSEAVPLHFVP